MKKRSRHRLLSTTHIIMLSFLLAVLAGSILLALPVSAADGRAVSYIDALFTATTSVCVTGLVTVPTVSTWSLFGQIVILILIQIGGLGVITFISAFMIDLHRKIGLGDRMLIQAAFNLNTLSGLVKFVRKVITGTFIVEGIGALVHMFVWVPEYGIKGVWISIFHAVSAFCNAGIDILSENSLCEYACNPVVNIFTSILIILGGIGYIVWWDVVRVLGNFKRQKLKCFRNLTLHSKIAISASMLLIAAGAAAFFIFEYHNPLTLQGYSLIDKIQISLFQSVTTRTAGFATIPQQNLTNASAILSLLWMFIGGSPTGTAGGIKTVTFAVLVASAFATIKNKDEVTFFHRNISKEALGKAAAVISMSFITMFLSTLLLAAVTDAGALDIAYETVSATATVGLTRNLTPSLNLWGKIIIIITMYLGRVGPISLAVAMNIKKERQNIIHNPTEKIIVG
ncbi:MAG: potassium transporter KtrB [Ruminococcus sp.]|nr:potassium transporter KtrB [Ruminococcus sp.]